MTTTEGQKRSAVGAFDLESVGLDISDPENRILTVAIYGDLHPDGIVIAYPEEFGTLSRFVKEAEGYDVLIGWNSDIFDVPLFNARLNHYGVDPELVKMPLFLDAMRVHQHMLRKGETSYTLDHVSKKHLGQGKLSFDPSKTLVTFKNDMFKLAEYNLHDARLVWMLNKTFGYYETFHAIVSGAGLDEVSIRKFAGISQKLEGGFAWWRPLMGLVTKFCKENNRPIPKWPTDDEKRARKLEMKDEARPGGWVEPPTPGHHKNVIEFDFKSLYPTLIQSFNLGADSEDPEGDIHPPFWRYSSRQRSVVASILDNLVEERSAVKAEYEKRRAEGATDEELAALKGTIEALKVYNNSFYGQMYATFSPLYHFNSARNITTLGQEAVQLMLARMREMGLTVVAGDTDSTYVSVPPEKFNKEFAITLSHELTRYVAEHFRKKYDVEFVGSFDFKSLISDMYIEKKKFYGKLELGKTIKDIEIRGYVRGNTPRLQRDLQRKVFEVMFSGGDIKAMIAAEREKFLSGKDYTGLISWMRPHSDPDGNTAQVRAARELTKTGVVILRFDQVGFLIIGSGKKQWRIAAHRLEDSTVEWLRDGETTLRLETEFLTPEEAEKMWNLTVKKLDGVPA